jgi:hypothetical protein
MCLLLVFYAYDKKSRMHIENLMPVPNKINLPPYMLIVKVIQMKHKRRLEFSIICLL